MATDYPPILLFAYTRPDHLQRTVQTLAQNHGADKHPLFVFSDGPRSEQDLSAVEEVRRLAAGISGFNSVQVIASEHNKGLAASIIGGVSQLLEQWDSVIVLEDDMETSPYFLQYMREGLQRYRDEPRVYSIHGYCYPISGDSIKGDSFFIRGTDCWGWATWASAWEAFESDAGKLLQQLRTRGLVDQFDHDGAFPFSRMLARQQRGEVDSWAIRWNASVFLRDGLTLNPKYSLVRNIGLDGSGEHCEELDSYEAAVSKRPLKVDVEKLEPDPEAHRQISQFLALQSGTLWRFKRWFRRITFVDRFGK